MNHHHPPVDKSQLITIERYILEQERTFADATGTLTALLYDLALAAKIIASRTTRAGLADILGSTGDENVHGEEVQKLDRFANRTIVRLNQHTGRVAIMASEEDARPIELPAESEAGPYVLIYDPLDGSSNIDCNVSVGTIFAIYRRLSKAGKGTLRDILQPGRNLVAAGYIIYGSSTMMVYSAGQGVHGFTLDPVIGEFLLSHPHLRIPSPPKYYSVNQGYERYWSRGVREFTRSLQGYGTSSSRLSLRYIGSLVADFHRNLLAGGIFYYPADSKDPAQPNGKLRLLYEAAPLAFLAQQAGGYGSNGEQPILDLQPSCLHQRTPFFVGSRDLVERAETFLCAGHVRSEREEQELFRHWQSAA